MPLPPPPPLAALLQANSAFSPRNSPRNSPRFRAQSQRFKKGAAAGAGTPTAGGGVSVISPFGSSVEGKTSVKAMPKAEPRQMTAVNVDDVPH